MTRDNIIAGGMMVLFCIIFLIWGIGYVGNYYMYFVIATVFGLFMAYNIGANDVANSFGTSVGSKTLTLKQALMVAAVFELSGAVFAGAEVTQTIREGIVSLGGFTFDPMLFVFVMMSALLSAGLWLLYASKHGMPVSTTHSIVGGIIGAGIALGYSATSNFDQAMGAVSWGKIGEIAISWVVSPVLGGLLSYMIFWFIKKYVLTYNDSVKDKIKHIKEEKEKVKVEFDRQLSTMNESQKIRELELVILESDESEYQRKMKELKKEEKKIDAYFALKTYVPIIATFGAISVAGMLLFKGLKHLNINLTTIETAWLLLILGIVAYVASLAFVNLVKKSDVDKTTWKVFAWLQIFTACSFAFSHGANDIANAVGPFVAILDVLHTNAINAKSAVPLIAMVTFGVAMVAGLWIFGKEVMDTIGSKLAEIFPVSGFSAELGATVVILLATKLGIPVSSTHILIGAVLGIGVLNKDANWALMKPIALAWVITIPASAVASGIIFYVLKYTCGY